MRSADLARRRIWVALAAVPAGLLIAVTAHISTDVAAVPLLWVLPLALYLLTFVIVFQSRPLIPHWLVPSRAAALHPGWSRSWSSSSRSGNIVGIIALHIERLLRQRAGVPRRTGAAAAGAAHLTAFYLWMSAGGMIGGIAAGLVAPHVFNWVAEYPILIVLAVLCRPGLRCRASAPGNIRCSGRSP